MKFFASLLALALLSACGTSAVYFSVKRPAPINMKDYKTIGIANFKSFDGDAAKVDLLANTLVENLLAAKYFDGVVDRKFIDDVVKEQKKSMNGLYRDEDMPQIGKLIGAKAFIYGSIDGENIQEKRTEEVKKWSKTNTYFSKEKMAYVSDIEDFIKTNQVLRTTYNLSVTFQIVDAESAKLVTSKVYNEPRLSVRASESRLPESETKESLFNSAVKDISRKFASQLVPYYITVQADFQTDGDLPEVESALRKIQNGFTEEALEVLMKLPQKATLKPEVRAKAFYNYGLALGFAGRYDESIANLKQASDLNPKEELYDRAMLLVKQEKENSMRVKAQE